MTEGPLFNPCYSGKKNFDRNHATIDAATERCF